MTVWKKLFGKYEYLIYLNFQIFVQPWQILMNFQVTSNYSNL